MPSRMSITQPSPQQPSSVVTHNQSFNTSSNSIVVSVPLTATSLPNSVQSTVTSAPTLYQQLQQSLITTAVNLETRKSAMPSVENYSAAEALLINRSR